jgi:hypothetical protein
MPQQPWVLPELREYEDARKLLGGLSEEPEPHDYPGWLELISRNVQRILKKPESKPDYWLEELWGILLDVGENAPALDQWLNLSESLWIESLKNNLSDYLGNRKSLDQFKKYLGLSESSRGPVSQEEFQQELEELTFEEWLLLVPNP